jgi:class 3 adenylate cyclase
MAETSSRTLVCSVLFLDLAAYSRNSVQEQLRLKEALSSLVTSALERVRQWDRVILDTGDGVAVVFLGDPEDALVAAIAVRDGAGKLALRMGVNLGPVRLVKDLNGQTNVIGDGINAAQRVMSFANPGQLLVSRGFHDVVSRLSDAHAKLFTRETSRRDKHVREHELFAVAGTEVPGPPRAGGGEARVFDAGPHYIVSGYDRVNVAKTLDALAARGARVISPITQVGDKWMASCEHPESRLGECKVESLGYTRIVTGPTQRAVSAKVDDLMQHGARLVGEIERTDDGWTAVCDTGDAGR